jgi:hypothetical protein
MSRCGSIPYCLQIAISAFLLLENAVTVTEFQTVRQETDMTRIRSPGYPSIPLEDAIVYAGKLWTNVRQNTIDREAAVKDIGYSGLTGQSAKMLSNLGHYGLIEKAGKGGVRVTDLAVSILHPNDPIEKREALTRAAYTPELYAELKNQYPDGYVSENALRNYLMRTGFSGVAVGPAIRSYLETYAFLRQENAIESHGVTSQPDSSSGNRADADAGTQVPAIRPDQPVFAEAPSQGVRVMSGERVVFVDESGPDQYLKLIAAGPLDESLLEALEDYVRRQKKRLGKVITQRGPIPNYSDSQYREPRGNEMHRRANETGGDSYVDDESD